MSAPSLLLPVLAPAIPACCEDERWEPVPDWPHEASTCGRVRSTDRIGEDGILRLGQPVPHHPDKRKGKGYLYVNLRDGKRHRRAAVAAVVLETHRRLRPGPGWEACHNDGVRTDNHLSNLRWDTREANLADMRKHQAERLATVTAQAAVTLSRHGSQVRRGSVRSRPGRYRVTRRRRGDGLKGTGRSPSFLPFRPVLLLLNPRSRPVRDPLPLRRSS